MQLAQKRSKFILACIGLLLGSSTLAAAPLDRFRTPAKQYGSAYSIKVKLKRGEFDWVVAVWVKPDQKISTLDAGLMSLMGWAEHKFEFDEVSLAGVKIDQKKFGQAKSDWAYFPDYAKSCCVGIIGQDILKNFVVRFDPRNPAHLEWKRQTVEVAKPKVISASDLQGIFSIRGVSFKKIDLTDTPYTLDFSKGELNFDESTKTAQPARTSSVLQYDFLPPVRSLQVLGITRDVVASAHRVGLKPGMTITMINGNSTGKLDRIEIDQILSGKKKDRITLTLNTKKEIEFDFKKNEFTAAGPISSRTR